MASLFVIQGANQGATYDLQGDRVSLGRDPTNTIQLHDQEVSRNHAELRREGRRYLLTDLGSSNGTFVNRVRVQAHPLVSGDQLQLGKTLMLFTGPSDESSADLREKVDIIAAGVTEENSRIVHTLGQDASSKYLGIGLGAGAPDTAWLARARSNLQIMYRTALAVSRTLDIDQLLQRITQLLFEWVEADRGCVMLIDAETRS